MWFANILFYCEVKEFIYIIRFSMKICDFQSIFFSISELIFATQGFDCFDFLSFCKKKKFYNIFHILFFFQNLTKHSKYVDIFQVLFSWVNLYSQEFVHFSLLIWLFPYFEFQVLR